MIDKEKKRAYNTRWAKANPDKVSAKMKRWRKVHPEKVRSMYKQWAAQNPDKIRAYHIKWREENLDKKHAHNAKWARENPEKMRVYKEKWRQHARKTNPEFRIKNRARQMASSKIKMIVCARCGSKERLERHHPDYNKPLEVVVVCHPCHLSEDRMRRACEAWDEIGI